MLLLVLLAPEVNAYTSSYMKGFKEGFALQYPNDQNACSDIPYNGSNSTAHDECITGTLAGEAAFQLKSIDNTTKSYHIGLNQGYIDHLISSPSRAVFDSNDTCKVFVGNQLRNCQQGYKDGWQKPINIIDQHQAIVDNKQTLVYKNGLFYGSHNYNISKACNGFNGRDTSICFNAYDDGILSLGFDYKQVYHEGYQYGLAASKTSEGGDEAGDCSYSPYSAEKQKVCEKAWEAGFHHYMISKHR